MPRLNYITMVSLSLPADTLVVSFYPCKQLGPRSGPTVSVWIRTVWHSDSFLKDFYEKELVRGARDSRANLMPIYGDLYQIKL